MITAADIPLVEEEGKEGKPSKDRDRTRSRKVGGATHDEEEARG